MRTGMTRRGFLSVGASAALGVGGVRVLAGCGDSGGAPAETVTTPGGGASSKVYAHLGDSVADLHGMAVRAAESLGFTGNALRGATVFIKPNFMRLGVPLPFDASSGDVTAPEITVGLAEQCLQAGAAKVIIGEGGQGEGWKWKEVLIIPDNTVYGVSRLVDAADYLNEKYGGRLQLVNLNEANDWARIPSSSKDPLVDQGLKVARSVLEADHVISVPSLKSHQWTQLTVSMKSLFGTTPLEGYRLIGEPGRYGLHMAYVEAVCGGVENAGVEGAYLDILSFRRDQGKQDFAVIDGSFGIEGDGPAGGGVGDIGLPGFGGTTVDIRQRTPIGKYFLLASDDLPAADATAARITGHEVEDMRQLVIARNLGLGQIHRVSLVGASLDELAMPNWKKAEPMPEWGTAPLPQASVMGAAGLELSRPLNVLSTLLCPLALFGVLKWVADRRRTVQEIQDLARWAEERAESAGRSRRSGPPAHHRNGSSAFRSGG